MALEVERKFKIKPGVQVPDSESVQSIRQAYLMSDGDTSIRVRIINDEEAYITIKKSSDMRLSVRHEYEYPLPLEDAIEMMQICQYTPVVKQRFVVMDGEVKWEVDIFQEENEGLIIAEVELPNIYQQIELPVWIGEEVTEDPRFLNSYLAIHPYRTWSEEEKNR